MKFKLFYCIFIITILLYPFVNVIGEVTLRHIMAAVMLIWLVVTKEFKMDRFLWAFTIFLFFYGISSIITGFGSTFIKVLFGTYLTCIVLYLSTKKMLMRHDALNWIIYLLMAVAIVDALVTIGQFFNNPIARTITIVLGVQNIDESIWNKYDIVGGALGGETAGGLLGGVENGYFLSAAVILSLFSRKGKIGFKNWIVFAFLLFALFATQERSGFGFGIICFVIYFFVNSRQYGQSKWVMIITLLATIMIGGDFLRNIVNVDETRYGILGSDMGSRGVLSYNAWQFVLDNPMGGAMVYFSNGGREPHNFVTNSFLYGGIFGGATIVGIVLFQIIRLIKIIYKSLFKKPYSLQLVVFALMYLAYTGNSAFHNPSMATGTAIFFLFWGVAEALYKQNRGMKND